MLSSNGLISSLFGPSFIHVVSDIEDNHGAADFPNICFFGISVLFCSRNPVRTLETDLSVAAA